MTMTHELNSVDLDNERLDATVFAKKKMIKRPFKEGRD